MEDLYTIKGYPKTSDEWWDLCIHYQDDLRNLINNFYPEQDKCRTPMEITAQAAENICEQFRQEIAAGQKTNPIDDFNKAIEIKNAAIVTTILSGTWFGMPESYEVREFPAFGVLCDLCSESYLVLQEEEEPCKTEENS